MPVPTNASDRTALHWLKAALEALDREGDTVAAAYVSMALARVERQAEPVSAA